MSSYRTMRGRLALAAFILPALAAAQTPTFTDVPSGDFAFEAVEYLSENGIIDGYPDGKFHPDQQVNRAEALKLILAALAKEKPLLQTTSGAMAFRDVPAGAWFRGSVDAALALGIIAGPPEKEDFLPDSPVLKAEFLKMTQEAFGVDVEKSFGEIRLPLSHDVANPDDWFYPYIRYGIVSSMTMISADGTLDPGRSLTRADAALLLHRFLMYRAGRRTQALLSETESELMIVFQFLKAGNIAEAEYASVRAHLAARGALAMQPDVPVVLGAVTVAEAFRSLVSAYRSGLERDYDGAIQYAGIAWNRVAEVRDKGSLLQQLSDEVQAIAKSIADSARSKRAPPSGSR